MNIAVFDLETNGTVGSSVLSASSIVFNSDGAILDIFNRFYLAHESPNFYATRIHGLTPGRLLALREHIQAPLYFLEDWPDLIDFWEQWNVDGVVVHNLSFDTSFLPEIAQSVLRWWCSMKGLTAYCSIPKRPGNLSRGGDTFKWPKLGEMTDIVCHSPQALPPSKETERVESIVGESFAHVSLFDCFELYRVTSRLIKHHRELLQFRPSLVPFRAPKKQTRGAEAFPLTDRFTTDVLAYEKKLRSVILQPFERM